MRKGGRGRIRKDADVEDVDVEADGEELALPSSFPLDGDKFRDKENSWGGRGRPCASARLQRRTFKKKTHFSVENRRKIELIIQ